MKRNRLKAAIFSILLPGLAQLYTAQGKKALVVMASMLAFLFVAKSRLILVAPPIYPVVVLAAMAGWIFAVVDGLRFATQERPFTWYSRWYVYLIAFFNFSLALIMIDVTKAVQPFNIPANSMAPSVLKGDRIFVDTFAFKIHEPKPGDLAVFRFPKDPRINYIKRIIGVPGDKIAIRDKKLFINEKEITLEPMPESTKTQAVQEDWFENEDHGTLTVFRENLGNSHLIAMNVSTLLNADFGPFQVAPGTYFTMGDNRDKSSDSRFWGTVPSENLIGKPASVWFSLNPENFHIRWERIGKQLE
ncbi:MAG: signal peptidase I [Bdellovibrionota bacterium]